MTWIPFLHQKLVALWWLLRIISTSFIIDNFDRSGSGSASSVMDALPSVFRTQLLGTKGAPPKTLHTRTCFFRSQLRRVFLKKCNTTPTLPPDLDWWHLRTLVVVWRLLEWFVKKYDHEMLLWVNIVAAHPWLSFFVFRPRWKTSQSSKQREIHLSLCQKSSLRSSQPCASGSNG